MSSHSSPGAVEGPAEQPPPGVPAAPGPSPVTASAAATGLSRAWLLRAVAHVVTWVPFFFGVTRSIQQGWAPTSDNAVIALRSWDVLTPHAPLLGQATRLAYGVFDLGPLQYWLLTVPVHLDAVHGVLWGAALWCMLAASLTVEVAWSVGGKYLALAASAVVLGVLMWNPQITVLPCWNPWFGIMYLLLALAGAWAVMLGRRGWWPVVVIAGSIAAQAHLMFAIASVAIVVLSLVVGLADTIRTKGRYRWLPAGFIAGAACWSAPLVQQFTSKHGNMAALLDGHGASGTKAGLGFGMKAIAAATQPPAYWWMPIDSLGKLSRVEGRPVIAGVVALVLVAVALLVAIFVLRCRWAAVLAALALVAAGGALFTYANIRVYDIRVTTSTINNLRYLFTPMYPLGVLSWLAVVSVVVLLVRRVRGTADTRPAGAGQGGAPAPGWSATNGSLAGVRVAGFAAAAALAVASVTTSALQDKQIGGGSFIMKAVGIASRQIVREIGPQRIAVVVRAPGTRDRRQLTMGLAYALRADGYWPVISPSWGLQLGPGHQLHGQLIPEALVIVRAARVPGGYTLAVQVMKAPIPRS